MLCHHQRSEKSQCQAWPEPSVDNWMGPHQLATRHSHLVCGRNELSGKLSIEPKLHHTHWEWLVPSQADRPGNAEVDLHLPERHPDNYGVPTLSTRRYRSFGCGASPVPPAVNSRPELANLVRTLWRTAQGCPSGRQPFSQGRGCGGTIESYLIQREPNTPSGRLGVSDLIFGGLRKIQRGVSSTGLEWAQCSTLCSITPPTSGWSADTTPSRCRSPARRAAH